MISCSIWKVVFCHANAFCCCMTLMNHCAFRDKQACSLTFLIDGTFGQQQQSLLRLHCTLKGQHFRSVEFNKAEFFPHHTILIEYIVVGSSEVRNKRLHWKQIRNVFFNNVNLTSAIGSHMVPTEVHSAQDSFFFFVWSGCMMAGLPLPSLSMAICMWALTSIVPVGTVDFIKFLTPQGYKSGYICKCFKLFNLSKCSMLSPRLCTSHVQMTLNHMSLTAFYFTFFFSYFLFASYNTCHFHRFIKLQL